jgi:hypothetical protein
MLQMVLLDKQLGFYLVKLNLQSGKKREALKSSQITKTLSEAGIEKRLIPYIDSQQLLLQKVTEK